MAIYTQLPLFGLPAPPPPPPVNFINALPTPRTVPSVFGGFPSPPPAPPSNFINALPRAFPNTTPGLPAGLGELGSEAATAGGASRFIPSALAPSAAGASATGRLAFLRNGAGGLKPGLAVGAGGLLMKGTGDYLRAQGDEGIGNALSGGGTLTTLAAPAAAIPGVAAAPLAAVAAAGGALGDIGASVLANPIRNALGMEELSNPHLSNLTDKGGALSWLPVVGGGSAGPAGPDLSPEGLRAKLDSFNLPPDQREAVKNAFNKQAADLRAQGIPLEQATQMTYAQFFEPKKDESGNITDNALALQIRDQAANDFLAKQQAEVAANDKIRQQAQMAAVFQSTLSQLAPEFMGHDPSSADRAFFASLPALYAANQAQINQASADQANAEYQKLLAQERIRQQSSGGGSDLASLLGGQ